MTKVVGRQAIAAIFGTSVKTIADWHHEGLPVAARGRSRLASEYDTVECIRWFVAREVAKVQPEAARERLLRARAEHAEAENAVRRGELIPAAQIEPAMRAAAISAREALLAVAQRLSNALVGLDRDAIERRISAEHEAFLQRISRLHAATPVDDEGDDDAPADTAEGDGA